MEDTDWSVYNPPHAHPQRAHPQLPPGLAVRPAAPALARAPRRRRRRPAPAVRRRERDLRRHRPRRRDRQPHRHGGHDRGVGRRDRLRAAGRRHGLDGGRLRRRRARQRPARQGARRAARAQPVLRARRGLRRRRARGGDRPGLPPLRVARVPTQVERRAQTRAKLLRAAGGVFARRGYHEATLDEIADKAGLSKGALYYNFASKEDLFMALLADRLEARLGEAERIEDFVATLERDPRWAPLFFEFVAWAGRDARRRAELRERFVRPAREHTRALVGEACAFSPGEYA